MASTLLPKSSTPVTSPLARRNYPSHDTQRGTERPPMDQPIQVQEKAPQPQGLLPKNVQSWLLAGLAFLMIAIIGRAGGKKPQTPTKTASTNVPVQAPLEVNETKIADLQNRIEELQRQQLVAQSALTQQTHLLGAAQDTPSSSQPSPGSSSTDQRTEDPIQA